MSQRSLRALAVNAGVAFSGRDDGDCGRSDGPPGAAGELFPSGAAGDAGGLNRPGHRNLTYLREVCELLWPPPAVVTVTPDGWAHGGSERHGGLLRNGGLPGDRAQAGGGEFLIVPGLHGPRLLVPRGLQGTAAVRHWRPPRSVAARLGVGALRLSMACGLGGALLPGRVRVGTPAGADTIETYLAGALSREVGLSMLLGPLRANRKPVLQLLDRHGPAGFAKVGVNELTCRLVRAEHDSLVRLGRAGLAGITIPRVLHYGRWRGLDVLVLSTLPAWRPGHRVPAARLTAAMTEVARVAGVRHETLSGSGYLGRLMLRLNGSGSGPGQTALWRALAAVTAEAGADMLGFGCWHGDWSPWNMSGTSRGLLVWDWERFTQDVPLGFDALHYGLQTDVVARRVDPRTAAIGCVERAAGLLAPFGVAPRQALLTAVLYLADLAVRYLADRQADAGARLGDPGAWLIPAVAGAASLL